MERIVLALATLIGFSGVAFARPDPGHRRQRVLEGRGDELRRPRCR